MYDDPIERKRKELRNDHARALMANTKPSAAARKHMEHDLPYFSKPEWGKWISCKTGRKPTDSTVYLVELLAKEDGQIVERFPAIAAWFDDEGWCVETLLPSDKYEVIRWTPLPQM